MGSELLAKLSDLDTRAEAGISAARAEAGRLLASLPERVAAMEQEAAGKLAAEVAAREAELRSGGVRELAEISQRREGELAALAAVRDSAIAAAAARVAAELTGREA